MPTQSGLDDLRTSVDQLTHELSDSKQDWRGVRRLVNIIGVALVGTAVALVICGVALYYATTAAQSANSSNRSQYDVCLAANRSRADTHQLWEGVIQISKNSGQPQNPQALAQFEALLGRATEPLPCHQS